MSLKDILHIQESEKILKIKSLVQAGIDIDSSVKINPVCDLNVQRLLTDFEATILNASTSFKLRGSSKEVSDYIAGYIFVKIKKHCCLHI